jgi:dTDP-4-dehydrorhamnose 3,5-epimerase
MIFRSTKLDGAYVIEPERHDDKRGFFARTWCMREFEQHGLIAAMVQASVSFNRKKGTLRGLHYQAPPSREAKLVRCTAGTIYDVIVDLRPKSLTFLQHVGVTLSAENRYALYIPAGFAHGFQTLADDAEVTYMMTDFYEPRNARGVRWNDPAFGIIWPEDERVIIERDNSYPDFGPELIRELEGIQSDKPRAHL